MLYQSWAHSYYRDNGHIQFIAVLFTISRKQLTCLPTGWIMKMWSIYKMEYCSAIFWVWLGLFLGQTTWPDLGTLHLLTPNDSTLRSESMSQKKTKPNQTSTFPFLLHQAYLLAFPLWVQNYLWWWPARISLGDSFNWKASRTVPFSLAQLPPQLRQLTKLGFGDTIP